MSKSITPTDIHNKITTLTEQGADIIPLHIGEPFFDIPNRVKDMMQDAIIDGYCDKYGIARGLPNLKESCLERLHYIGVPEESYYSADSIVLGPGGRYLIASIIEMLARNYIGTKEHFNVLIPTPAWPAYADHVHYHHGYVTTLAGDKENDYKITADQLEDALEQKLFDLFIWNNPCNPTGAVYSREEIADLTEVLERYPACQILSDDVYASFASQVDGYAHILDVEPALSYRTFCVDSMSKAFSMTGERFGFAAVPEQYAQPLEKLIAMRTTAVGAVAQAAALAAYSAPPDQKLKMKWQSVAETRMPAIVMLNEVPHLSTSNPQGAFYIFVDASELIGRCYRRKKINNIEKLCDMLIDIGVGVVPGRAFGEANCFRISCATNRAPDGIERIAAFVAETSEISLVE